MKKSAIVKNEFKASLKGINKGDLVLSQILYTLMNFASGGGIAGMPISTLISTFSVKATYDGHRYNRGDANFNKKRRHFFKNMYVGLAGGTVPRIVENIQQLATEYGAETLAELVPMIANNIGDLTVVQGGLWNEHSLAAILVFQFYSHLKEIVKNLTSAKNCDTIQQ